MILIWSCIDAYAPIDWYQQILKYDHFMLVILAWAFETDWLETLKQPPTTQHPISQFIPCARMGCESLGTILRRNVRYQISAYMFSSRRKSIMFKCLLRSPTLRFAGCLTRSLVFSKSSSNCPQSAKIATLISMTVGRFVPEPT